LRSADLYIAGVVILVLGLTSASVIYATAEESAENATLQEMALSKQYVRQLQRFGGKASVLFDDLQRWFDGLWHGRSLAGTVAAITVFAAFVIFLVARAQGRREKLRP